MYLIVMKDRDVVVGTGKSVQDATDKAERMVMSQGTVADLRIFKEVRRVTTIRKPKVIVSK